ncbi:ribosome small subunit-dependent GTPase A [Tahibacter amnicola]|uniref:Small ribosomal subunit biogenesis GTPase RsgA n=1 Tax=Tahibacter amnicola TaxID=2976241 RepID=A0ABY6BGK0_9GAMM|nr:ribosome small subunit-dependent GTPase A [Tahibacter amnicola]UXI69154.1 ribosome small subunit-dependent GTPase A [Tahibacter amnicola]
MELTPEHGARLAAIGWRSDITLPADAPDQAIPARVIVQHRNGYVVHDGEKEFTAQPAPRFLKRNLDPTERPAVGDFVLLKPGKPPQIETILPRHALLSRAAAGERYQRQPIATNVDTVLVLMGLDGDFNPRRLERYLALIQASGAHCVVVLTKADRHDDLDALLVDVGDVLPPDTIVHAVNAKDAASIAVLHPYLGPGLTAVLVGSSGVGKSTLTNTLLGVERQATREVREHDSRGRHTTTFRALIALPQGGCLIDTPGMRELKLTGEENLEAGQFADIEALATQCRFGDCAHMSEPGCAVRAALEQGDLDSDRWHSYQKLRDEIQAQASNLEAQLKRKGEARILGKALGQRLKEKYGHR